MSLQKKLDRAYTKGVEDTWQTFYTLMSETKGIGPKTREKILKNIVEASNGYKNSHRNSSR